MEVRFLMTDRYITIRAMPSHATVPADVEIGAGWDACLNSLKRPAAQAGVKALVERGFHEPGDVENRLGYYLGQLAAGSMDRSR